MQNKKVEKPVMTLKSGGQTFQLWVLNPGQWCQCSNARCHEFQARKTGSLIYESFGVGSHSCIEHELNDANTWEWIQTHMQANLDRLNNLQVA